MSTGHPASTGYSALTGELRAEARRWRDRCDAVGELHRAVAGLALPAESFLVVELVSGAGAEHGAGYRRVRSRLADALAAGADEFDRMGGALSGAADRYDDAEGAAGAGRPAGR